MQQRRQPSRPLVTPRAPQPAYANCRSYRRNSAFPSRNSKAFGRNFRSSFRSY